MSFHLDSICSSLAHLYVFCTSKLEMQDITACFVFNIAVNRYMNLTLSLPEFLIKFCKVTLTFESVDEIV